MLSHLFRALVQHPESAELTNHYRDERLRHNLSAFFHYLRDHPPRILLVGEAAGYQGSRLTGIPLSSGPVIRQSTHPLWETIREDITLPRISAEPSATILWDYLERHRRPAPLIWNAFPFHPHEKNNGQSNRPPRKSELQDGQKFLAMVLEEFSPQGIYGLGRKGQQALEMLLGKEVPYIRHPAQGGKRACLSQLGKAYARHYD